MSAQSKGIIIGILIGVIAVKVYEKSMDSK